MKNISFIIEKIKSGPDFFRKTLPNGENPSAGGNFNEEISIPFRQEGEECRRGGGSVGNLTFLKNVLRSEREPQESEPMMKTENKTIHTAGLSFTTVSDPFAVTRDYGGWIFGGVCYSSVTRSGFAGLAL